jgi:8-oxo-dGTP diphosphatase
MQDATLILLLKGKPVSQVCLGYKKIGLGLGKYTGFGGKVEPGEGVAEAARRELAEETSVIIPNPENLDFRAILEFRFPRKRAWEQRVFVFCTHHWQGIPTESNEMIPQWYPIEEIPYHQMWDDARYWLPRVLSGEKFQAQFEYQADNATVAIVTFEPLKT